MIDADPLSSSRKDPFVNFLRSTTTAAAKGESQCSSTPHCAAGVLDLRRGNAQTAFVRGALRIDTGMRGLEHRYSWLPPRSTKAARGEKWSKAGLGGDDESKRLIVLCDEEERAWAERKLAGWNVAAVLTTPKDDVVLSAFWSAARDASLLEHDVTRLPPAELLFEPSPIARVAGKVWETLRTDRRRSARLLDLGCGAGRDMAWIVRNGREREGMTQWRVTGVDNVASVARRAWMLAQEMGLDKPNRASDGTEQGFVEAILCAEASSDGALVAVAVEKRQNVGSNPAAVLQGFASDHLPHVTYDVVLLARFLPLALLPNLPVLTVVDSLIAISHFTTLEPSDEVKGDRSAISVDFVHPSREKRFNAHHIDDLVRDWHEQGGTVWTVVHHTVTPCEDGRPLRNVIFRRQV